MKKHSQMLKGLLGIIAGITLLLALALPAFAEQDVTLSVIVRDENSDPLKGAVFTLVSNVENDKTAYTSAASDENGMAVFTGLPQNGEFDLSQKSAPEGYLKDEHIYLITINNGSVYTLYDGELAEYETVAAENKKYTPWGTLRKEGAPGRLLYLSLISSRKRCNPCGYAVFSLLRSVRCCWKASSISSGVSSWRMPTPL